MPKSAELKCYFKCDIDGPLHRFPKWEYPHTEKFNQWKSVLDNTIQERGNNYIYNSIRICHKHFEEHFKSSSRRLTRNAVPTLNLMAHPSSPQKAECVSDVSAVGSPTLVEPFSPSSPYDQDFAPTDPLLLYQQGIQLDTNQDFSSPPPAANDQDNSKLCRVCGKDNITLIHLFSEEASHNNLVQKINKYLPIVVDLHDELPLGVCQSCATAVLNWHSLVQCCIKTDKLLASKLQHSKESVYKPNGENSTKNDDAKMRTRIGEGPCVCHVCGKQLRTPKGLQRHLTETHERQRRYICAVCTKNFANSQNLKQHARIHTGERPYVCAQCGKRFTQSGSLHVHLKTHGAQLPHACAECGARFRLRSGLARHRLRHSGERPHACSACGKAFRQRHELAAHALTHSDCKPHACDTCGSAFRQRRALRHHCRRLHAAQATHGALATHDAHATHDTRATHDALATHQPIAHAAPVYDHGARYE